MLSGFFQKAQTEDTFGSITPELLNTKTSQKHCNKMQTNTSKLNLIKHKENYIQQSSGTYPGWLNT